jgi:hypothetical protein
MIDPILFGEKTHGMLCHNSHVNDNSNDHVRGLHGSPPREKSLLTNSPQTWNRPEKQYEIEFSPDDPQQVDPLKLLKENSSPKSSMEIDFTPDSYPAVAGPRISEINYCDHSSQQITLVADHPIKRSLDCNAINTPDEQSENSQRIGLGRNTSGDDDDNDGAYGDHRKDEEEAEEDFVPKFDRAAIVSALFPKGYPDVTRKQTMKKSTPVSTLNRPTLLSIVKRRIDPGHVANIILKTGFDLQSVESPTQEPATMDSSVNSDNGSEFGTKKSNTNNECASHSFQPIEQMSIIGMTISWDPTWELLDLGSSPIAMPKSKLKILQESESNEKRLLRSIRDDLSEESSYTYFDFSMKLGSTEGRRNIKCDDYDYSLDFQHGHHFDAKRIPAGASPTALPLRDFIVKWEESIDIDEFVLGFHFDHQRFPEESSDEIEIVFVGNSDESYAVDDDAEDDEDDAVVDDCVEIVFSCMDEVELSDASIQIQSFSTCFKSASSSPVSCLPSHDLSAHAASPEIIPSIHVNGGHRTAFDYDDTDESSAGVISCNSSKASNAVESLLALCTVVH